MGVVKRQSAKTTLIQYAMLPLGVVASIFIYPYNSLTNDAFGYFNYVVSIATLLSPLLFWGIPNISIKFFPYFKNPENGHNGFLTYLFLSCAGVLIISLSLVYFFQDYIFGLGKNKETYITDYRFIIFPVVALFGLISLMSYYISNFSRIVVPSLLDSLRNRIGVPILILICGLGFFSFHTFAWMVFGLFALHFLLLVSYLGLLGELKLKPVNRSLVKVHRKEMINFSLFAILGTVGGTLCTQIDSIMITELIDVRSNGVYSIGRNISNVVSVPSKAVFAVIAPIIASLLADKNTSEVDAIYKRASNVLLTSGLFIFLMLTVAIGDIVEFMNKSDIDYSEIIIIVSLLGISIVFNMITSINSHIIVYSKYYRFNVLLIILLGVLNILLNLFFIQYLKTGIIGAAYASVISLVIYDLIKFIFIWIKLGMQPLQKSTIYVLILGASIFLLFLFLKFDFGIIPNIIIKELLLFALFAVPVYYFKLSPEINKFVHDALNRIKKLIGR